MKSTKKIKLALVHDDFIQFGGAEKFFLDLIKELQANEKYQIKLFASLISEEWQGILAKNNIEFEQSFLAKIPFACKFHKLFFISNLFNYAFLNFNFDGYFAVISSSTRYGHGILTKPHTYHISYLNSPAKALWDEKRYFFGKKFLHFIVKNFLPQKRIYDFYSQNYADLVITNSKNIQKKVKKIYHRKSLVLYPFVKLPKKINHDKSNYYLIISRLVSWKRLDYVIEAFNISQKPLIIIGDGPEKENYKMISKSNIKFLGYVSDEAKTTYLSKARALIFPQAEDFGLTIIEALNQDCPVIYYNQGGAPEILNSKLGVSYSSQTLESFNSAIQQFETFDFDKEYCLKYLDKFSKNYFITYINRVISLQEKLRKI